MRSCISKPWEVPVSLQYDAAPAPALWPYAFKYINCNICNFKIYACIGSSKTDLNLHVNDLLSLPDASKSYSKDRCHNIFRGWQDRRTSVENVVDSCHLHANGAKLNLQFARTRSRSANKLVL